MANHKEIGPKDLAPKDLAPKDGAPEEHGADPEEGLQEHADPLEASRRAALRSLLQGEKRLERRAVAIRGDLARGALAQTAALQARWFVVPAGRASRGARELTTTDASTGEVLTLALDPARSAREQVEAIFARARRMQNGMKIAEARLAETEASLRSSLAKRHAIEVARSIEEVRSAAGLDKPSSLPLRLSAPRGRAFERRPYRLFKSRLGTPILVGRRAADNDALTFHVARPRDLWLHARGTPGAHVVVPLEKDKEAPAETLVDAAHLAAYFSTRREETSVEIDYARRGRVRKPRGSPPGLVVVDQAKSIFVRIEKDRLAHLLATEEITKPEPQRKPRRRE